MAWAYIQGVSNAAVTSSPMPLVMPGSSTSGNTMIIYVKHGYAGCPPSVTDTRGSVYTAKGTHPAGLNGFFWVFTAPITSSGANTVTVTFACSTARMAAALEFSGLDVNPFDQQNTNTNTTTAATTGSVTTTANGELILCMWVGSTTPTYTPTGGAITRVTNSLNDIITTQLQVTAGAITGTATASSASVPYPVGGFIATFKAAVVASTAFPSTIPLVGFQ